MALTIEQRIELACKVRDIQLEQKECFDKLFDTLESKVSACGVSDRMEDKLFDVFIGILVIQEVVERDQKLLSLLALNFYLPKYSNDQVISMVEDFIE